MALLLVLLQVGGLAHVLGHSGDDERQAPRAREQAKASLERHARRRRVALSAGLEVNEDREGDHAKHACTTDKDKDG